MAWTAPRTWADTELITAAMMNQHLRDNLLALKRPASGVVQLASDISTTSTSFVDMPGASLTLVTTGDPVLLTFVAPMRGDNNTGSAVAQLRFTVDGVATPTLNSSNLYSGQSSFLFTQVMWHRVTGLAAGSHTFKAQWKVGAGTLFINGATQASGVFTAAEALLT